MSGLADPCCGARRLFLGFCQAQKRSEDHPGPTDLCTEACAGPTFHALCEAPQVRGWREPIFEEGGPLTRDRPRHSLRSQPAPRSGFPRETAQEPQQAFLLQVGRLSLSLSLSWPEASAGLQPYLQKVQSWSGQVVMRSDQNVELRGAEGFTLGSLQGKRLI